MIERASKSGLVFCLTFLSAGFLATTGLSYCGRYEVQSDKIFHYVEVSSLAVWNGTVQERMYKLEGDRMTLLTAPLLVASEAPTACLVWDRVVKAQ